MLQCPERACALSGQDAAVMVRRLPAGWFAARALQLAQGKGRQQRLAVFVYDLKVVVSIPCDRLPCN